MTRPHGVRANDALDNLVDQFADPLAFLRELVQNALDAGSNEVDVWTRFEPADDAPDEGLMTIAVDDYGEGMDRAIIDNQLTRLFSSAKDDDFTKIGKFGIGFVSVFALRPDAVTVDTSRGGESWRVLFRPDRSFVRISRDLPVDGTKVHVHKRVDRTTFEDLSRRCRETLAFWCKHVRVPIRFDDTPINAPFELDDAVCTVQRETDGIRVVAGLRSALRPFAGFYNGGLTLYEASTDEFLPGVAFKVDSKYLEHTLTRDNILRDEHFEKAMRLVREAAEDLDDALWDALSAALDDGRRERHDLLCGVAARRLRDGHAAPSSASDAPVAVDVGGRPCTLTEVRKAGRRGRLFHEDGDSELVASVVDHHGATVVRGTLEESPGVIELLDRLADAEVRPLRTAWVLPRRAHPPAGTDWRLVASSIDALLQVVDIRIADIEFAHFDGRHSTIANDVFVLVENLRVPTPRDEHLRPLVDAWPRKRTLVMNVDHVAVEEALICAADEPELAACALVKLLHLDRGLVLNSTAAGGPSKLSVELDTQLVTESTRLRCRRLKISWES